MAINLARGYVVPQAGDSPATMEAMRGRDVAKTKRMELRSKEFMARKQNQWDMEARKYEHSMQQRQIDKWMEFVGGPFREMGKEAHTRAREMLQMKFDHDASRTGKMIEFLTPFMEEQQKNNRMAMEQRYRAMNEDDTHKGMSKLEELLAKLYEAQIAKLTEESKPRPLPDYSPRAMEQRRNVSGDISKVAETIAALKKTQAEWGGIRNASSLRASKGRRAEANKEYEAIGEEIAILERQLRTQKLLRKRMR